MATRDRDEAGRPRNARPRDETGRPLARDASGVPTTDDEFLGTTDEALAAAQRALEDGRPFLAHEYLESAWRQADQTERDLWQGLAQFAVALTHVQRGNSAGALALFARSRVRLSPYAGATPHGIDVDGVRAAAESLAHTLTDGGDVAVDAVRLLVRPS